MKTIQWLLICSVLFLSGCVTLTPKHAKAADKSRATADVSVDWDKVAADVRDLLAPRAVTPTRQDATTWGQLWGISLKQELGWGKSEADKKAALDYVTTVASEAKRLQLPVCTWRLRWHKVACRTE